MAVVVEKFDTQFSADCVEFVPNRPDLLLCGTYQLTENEDPKGQRVRVGRVLLVNVDTDQTHPNILKECFRLESAAVLDAKWRKTSLVTEHALVGIATAASELMLMKLDSDSTTLTQVSTGTLPDNKATLCLSLDWQDRVHTSQPGIVTSDALGRLQTWKLRPDGLDMDLCWIAHDYEAWICASDGHDPNIVYSGGDDALFKVWDTREPTDSPTHVKQKHTAGVCSIQKHPIVDHLLMTGSYDDHVLLWDTRNWARPLSSYKTSGGVWRIKWHETDTSVCALACMYGGAQVIQVKQNCEMSLACAYQEHSSITYGIDWRPTRPSSTIATCSFYDHSLHLWNIEP